MRVLVAAIAAVLAIGIAGCGGAKHVTFPVDDAKVLSTVSTAELQSMCESVIIYAKDALDIACLTQGVSAKLKEGGTEQICQTKVNTCRAELQSKTLTCKLVDAKQLQGCNATVGEYETCINDTLVLLNTLRSKLSCSVSAADMATLSAEMKSMPPSCQSFAAKCPQLMGTDDGG
jgi:hypothetical protein